MASAAIPDEPRKEDHATEDAYYDALSDYYAQWSPALWKAADPNIIWRNPALDNPWVSEICDKLIELSVIDDKAAHQQALVEAGITDEVLQDFIRKLQKGRLRQPSPVSAQEMREIDAFTINSMGMPSMVLMERAALACVARLEKGDFDLTSTLALCGTGNNGGDGMAIARLLRLAGRKARIVVVGDCDNLSMDATQQLAIAKNYGVPVASYSPGCLKDVKAATIIDALFGVGLSRPVEGIYREALAEGKELAASGTGILAVDVPSGISADTGEILGEALPARATVTFAYNKTGLVRDPGKTMAGDLTVADIGVYDIGTLNRESELPPNEDKRYFVF